MIPKLSAPLVKDIRTGEGILEWVLAALGVAAGATGNLSVSHTGVYLLILAGIKSARRGLVKLVTVQKAAGIGAPLQPYALTNITGQLGNVANEALPEVQSVLSDILSTEKTAATAQATQGAPPESVTAGLAPDPPAAEPTP